MYPTLKENDIILTNPLFKVEKDKIYGFVYKNKNYIKRAIAITGNVVEIKKGTIYINSIPYKEYYYLENMNPIKILKNQVFFSGDNFSESFDSKNFGCVDIKSIKFQIIMILFPFDRWRIF